MAENKLFDELAEKSANRRSFVKKLGIAGAVLGAAAATSKSGLAQATSISDADILNFALNLEYLEAEFYTIAVTGKNISQSGLTVSGSGNAGATTGGTQVNFGTNSMVQNIAAELAADEQTHVTLLQTAIAGLGGTPIAKPAINLNALGFGFGSVNDFLKLSRIFEGIGVTAYGGAAPLITSKTVLGTAARILATEAVHVGNIRLLIAQAGIPTTALDGADILPPPSGTLYFPTNANALTEIRTPGQVLFLAYAAPNATSGGFFPSGANGNPALGMSAASGATNDLGAVTVGSGSASLTITPDPAPFPGLFGAAVVTVSWNAPSASIIEVHVGSPTGQVFTRNLNSGSMQTGPWVTNGLTFFLQDVSNGPAAPSNTIAAAVAAVRSM